MTARYMSLKEVAAYIGVSSVRNYKLPTPDAIIGTTRGWTQETIDAWNARRPGRGYRSDIRTGYDWATGEHRSRKHSAD